MLNSRSHNEARGPRNERDGDESSECERPREGPGLLRPPAGTGRTSGRAGVVWELPGRRGSARPDGDREWRHGQRAGCSPRARCAICTGAGFRTRSRSACSGSSGCMRSPGEPDRPRGWWVHRRDRGGAARGRVRALSRCGGFGAGDGKLIAVAGAMVGAHRPGLLPVRPCRGRVGPLSVSRCSRSTRRAACAGSFPSRSRSRRRRSAVLLPRAVVARHSRSERPYGNAALPAGHPDRGARHRAGGGRLLRRAVVPEGRSEVTRGAAAALPPVAETPGSAAAPSRIATLKVLATARALPVGTLIRDGDLIELPLASRGKVRREHVLAGEMSVGRPARARGARSARRRVRCSSIRPSSGPRQQRVPCCGAQSRCAGGDHPGRTGDEPRRAHRPRGPRRRDPVRAARDRTIGTGAFLRAPSSRTFASSPSIAGSGTPARSPGRPGRRADRDRHRHPGSLPGTGRPPGARRARRPALARGSLPRRRGPANRQHGGRSA